MFCGVNVWFSGCVFEECDFGILQIDWLLFKFGDD